MRKHTPEKTAFSFYLLTNRISIHISACPILKEAGNRYHTISGLAIRLSFCIQNLKAMYEMKHVFSL